MSHIPNSAIVIKRGLHGLGLFTTASISRGAFIIEYTGEKVNEAEKDRRGGQYLFALNEEWFLDGKGREHTARYINHSCRPNCYAELTEDETHVYIYAKRAIKAGEELTYHYGKEFWEEYIKPKGCRCSKCCQQ